MSCGNADGNVKSAALSVPVPTFVSLCSTRCCERRNQRDISIDHMNFCWAGHLVTDPRLTADMGDAVRQFT